MEPVVAAANPAMGYGLSGVRLPPTVPSRVGGNGLAPWGISFNCALTLLYGSHQHNFPLWTKVMTEIKKRPPGRPKGSTNKKFSLTSFAEKPNILPMPKTEAGQLKELKNLLINSAGSRVVHKAVEIALNDEHPAQLAAIKLCMDRMLPVSMFEKEGKQRSAVTINITGIGEQVKPPTIIDTGDAEDIESR